MTPMRLFVLVGLLVCGGCASSDPQDGDPNDNIGSGSNNDNTPDGTDGSANSDDSEDTDTNPPLTSDKDCSYLPLMGESNIGFESVMWMRTLPTEGGDDGGIHWANSKDPDAPEDVTFTAVLPEGERTPDDITGWNYSSGLEEFGSDAFFAQHLACDRCADQLGPDGIGTCDILIALEIDGCRGVQLEGWSSIAMPVDAISKVTWTTRHPCNED